jgi:hypothetical protein
VSGKKDTADSADSKSQVQSTSEPKLVPAMSSEEDEDPRFGEVLQAVSSF